jgi:Zn-dependent protease
VLPLREALILFGCLVVAIILHEISHGVAALGFGDDTAKRAGRLTLNPLPHIDPFGSIILPALGALTGLPVIGWAKPVPVNPARMRHPRRDIVFVSLAGPTTNFVLMAIAAVAARAEYRNNRGILGGAIDTSTSSLLLEITFFFAVVNLLLGIFNLLPIPPLDGSALIERLLPSRWLPMWYQVRPYGLLALFLLVFAIPGFVSTIVSPFYDALYRFVVS